MAEKWVRQADGYEIDHNVEETSGVEVYYRDDNHAAGITPANLPTIGSTELIDEIGVAGTAGSAITSCICREVKARYQDGDTGTPARVYRFSTVATSGSSGGGSTNTDSENRAFRLGTELMTIQNPEATWKWSGTNEDVTQPISKLIGTGEFSIPKGPMTQAEYETWIALVIAAKGKINSDNTWDPRTGNEFAAGQVLFLGIDGGTVRDGGTIKWQFTMQFAFRIIGENDYNDVAITSNDWQYLWNHKGDRKGWDKPVAKTGGANLYDTIDFATIM